LSSAAEEHRACHQTRPARGGHDSELSLPEIACGDASTEEQAVHHPVAVVEPERSAPAARRRHQRVAYR
jgi:hypothetical protein